MVDSVAVFQPGTRFQTASGTILAGGSVEFYSAGTTDPLTVYSDSGLSNALGSIVYLDAGGAPVAEQGSSTKVTVYVGTASYKVIVKDANGNTIETKDNIRGAFDSSSIFESLTLIPQTVVETLTGAATLTSDDIGQLKNCNTTGGGFAVTLPDATALNNGARFGFRMAGSANAVTIKSTQGQTIARAGITSTSFALSRFGETVWLVNDGGNWIEDTYVPPLHNTVGVIAIADRLATPPDSPNAGARYIVTSGPTGAWSSYAEHDIVEADGNGGWFRYTPPADCGWIAYVQDEDIYYTLRGSAWVAEVTVASEAEMKSASSLVKTVSPGRQHFHPAHPKAWGYVTVSSGVPTLVSSYNIAGITDNGTGRLGVTLDIDFASADYCVLATLNEHFAHVVSKAAGSFVLGAMEASNGYDIRDPGSYNFACFGELSS